MYSSVTNIEKGEDYVSRFPNKPNEYNLLVKHFFSSQQYSTKTNNFWNNFKSLNLHHFINKNIIFQEEVEKNSQPIQNEPSQESKSKRVHHIEDPNITSLENKVGQISFLINDTLQNIEGWFKGYHSNKSDQDKNSLQSHLMILHDQCKKPLCDQIDELNNALRKLSFLPLLDSSEDDETRSIITSKNLPRRIVSKNAQINMKYYLTNLNDYAQLDLQIQVEVFKIQMLLATVAPLLGMEKIALDNDKMNFIETNRENLKSIIIKPFEESSLASIYYIVDRVEDLAFEYFKMQEEKALKQEKGQQPQQLSKIQGEISITAEPKKSKSTFTQIVFPLIRNISLRKWATFLVITLVAARYFPFKLRS